MLSAIAMSYLKGDVEDRGMNDLEILLAGVAQA